MCGHMQFGLSSRIPHGIGTLGAISGIVTVFRIVTVQSENHFRKITAFFLDNHSGIRY